MSDPRLVLHIGSHKTGTSALQGYLRERRVALREEGIVYPRLPRTAKSLRGAHHHIATALSSAPAPAFEARHLADFLARLRAEARPEETIVISSERFWRSTLGPASDGETRDEGYRRFVRKVAEAFAGFDTRIVAALRPQDDYILSSYKGACTRGGKVAPLARVADARAAPTDYAFRLGCWAEAFGPDRVRVHLYDPRLRGAEGLQAMFDGFGIVHRVSDAARARDRHVSPADLAMCEVMRAVNLLGLPKAAARSVKAEALQSLAPGEAAACLEAIEIPVAYPRPPAEVNEEVRRTWFPASPAPLFGREVREGLSGFRVRDPEALARIVGRLCEAAGQGEALAAAGGTDRLAALIREAG